MFLDEVEIYVRGGKGGNGCISFRRERGVPRGGPDGGDGGEGGSVILKVNPHLSTLSFFYYEKTFVASSGKHGRGKNQKGSKGKDLILFVPPGTVVYDSLTGEILADLKEEGEEVVVARGGKGGRGNVHFKSSTHQTPRGAEEGEKGEERWLRLELKLIADVGLVGAPNAGKSTLLSVISHAHPRIASYPFTTLFPFLGVVVLDEERSFVAADLPGLIEGASEGKGLGDKFLKHIERTKVLLHLVDVGTEENADPFKIFKGINEELKAYNPSLLKKPQIVVPTKMDLPGAEERFQKLKKALEKRYPIFPISAWRKRGIKELLEGVWNILQQK